MSQDIISDALNKIMNAKRSGKKEVVVNRHSILLLKIMEMAKDTFSDAKLDTRDGYRFDLEDGWFHLRTSNTEPVMRFIIEARDKAAAQKYIKAISSIRQKVSG